MPSYDEPLGYYKLTSSTKFFYEYLKHKLENYIIFFNEACVIENFSEKMETENYPDNTIIILENCYFNPAEIGMKYISSPVL